MGAHKILLETVQRKLLRYVSYRMQTAVDELNYNDLIFQFSISSIKLQTVQCYE